MPLLASNFDAFVHLFFGMPLLVASMIASIALVAVATAMREAATTGLVAACSVAVVVMEYYVFCVWLGTGYWFDRHQTVAPFAKLELFGLVISVLMAAVTVVISIVRTRRKAG